MSAVAVERRGAVPGEDFFQQVEEVAAVAIGHRHQRGAGILGERRGLAHVLFGAGEQLGEGGFVEALQHHDLRAGQQRAVEFEAGVLGGGADQRDDAALDEWQEAILLGAVEAVDLVDEQQRALAGGAQALGFLEGGAQVLHAGEDGGELFEFEPGALGQQARDGGLAGSGRPPEDELARRPCASMRPIGPSGPSR